MTHKKQILDSKEDGHELNTCEAQDDTKPRVRPHLFPQLPKAFCSSHENPSPTMARPNLSATLSNRDRQIPDAHPFIHSISIENLVYSTTPGTVLGTSSCSHGAYILVG